MAANTDKVALDHFSVKESGYVYTLPKFSYENGSLVARNEEIELKFLKPTNKVATVAKQVTQVKEGVMVDASGNNYEYKLDKTEEYSEFIFSDPNVVSFKPTGNIDGNIKGVIIEKVNSKTPDRFDGITTEGLMQVLLSRLRHIQSVSPSRELSIAITNLEQSILWLDVKYSQKQPLMVPKDQLNEEGTISAQIN